MNAILKIKKINFMNILKIILHVYFFFKWIIFTLNSVFVSSIFIFVFYFPSKTEPTFYNEPFGAFQSPNRYGPGIKS